MRNTVIDVKFNLLRVDKDKLDLVGCRLIKNARNNRVYADRLTHTGCTGDKKVGHFRYIKHDRRTADVFTEADCKFALCLAEGLVFDKLTESYRRNDFVRNLDTYRRFTGDRRFDSDTRRCKRKRNIVNKVCNRANSRACLGNKLVTGDRRTSRNA